MVAVKRHLEEFTYATPQTVLQAGDSVIVSGATDVVEKFSELT